MSMGDSSPPKLELYNSPESSMPVQGQMSIPMPNNDVSGRMEFNTLDEPVMDTIKRDLKAVGSKFKHVLYPVEKNSLLKEWDLWGPLLLCTFMAMILQGTENLYTNDGGPEFAEVFVIVWVGAFVVTLNSKLLGGHISFFQSVCVLGYCLLPTALALLACEILLIFEQTAFPFILRFLVTSVGFAWATFASMVFLGDSQPQGKKGLAVYPMFLFYFVISWLVLSHNGR